ncbi:phage terminase large subunit [Phocoenobacter skyensis]|uniref:Phage terminase large subunit n=1 Tax=Phocoenobacter skyensis TaxID=97481 RepID=A0ABT9JIB1_9PAST|nr:phage terminase large subunit [Pasteurella skyensis]MDP8078347.1 phage terminase large subunit [Pasteurella skyensis]MDP8084561.1 phage terminase large subunit [Pasteurella skyensis]
MSSLNFNLHKQQTKAFLSEANEILYGGAAGGGKSHLMRVVAIMLCSQVDGLQVYLFRRLSDDLYKNHMEGAAGFFTMLSSWFESKLVKFNGSKNYVEFWNGSKIWLSHCQHEKDLIKYQGAEIHVLLIDELTHFTEKQYRFLRGRVRLGGLKVPDNIRLPLIITGSNPGGVGHNWVKRMFVDFATPLSITRTDKKEGGMLRQYIPAKIEDNPTLLENDPDYIDRLEGLGTPSLIKAMRNGDWNIVAGGALDDVWSNRLILPRFKIPKSWRVDRSFDWGSSHPFSVGWWAECDGSEVEINGKTFCPPKGSLIRINEWYGTKQAGSNEGLKLSAKEIAEGIVKREKAMLDSGWIAEKPKAGPADNQINNVINSDTPTIAEDMAKKGIKWTKSDKSAGSRVTGLELLRTRMKEANKNYPEEPCIYFMDNCLATISTLPVLPRDSNKIEDIDTKAEDHIYDDIRYRVLAGKRQAMSINMGTAF